jgi:hypothetical protein
MPRDWNVGQRTGFWAEIEHLVWPVWQKDMGFPALMSMAEDFENVAIPHSTVEEETTLAARVNALVSQHQTALHGLSLAKPDDLRAIRWDTVSTLSWLSPMRRGDPTHRTGTGTRLVR